MWSYRHEKSRLQVTIIGTSSMKKGSGSISPPFVNLAAIGYGARPRLRRGQIVDLDQPLLDHLFIAEPQVGNVRRAESQNVFQRTANFPKPKVHANAFEHFNQGLRAFREHRPQIRALGVSVQPMVSEHIHRAGPAAMANDA